MVRIDERTWAKTVAFGIMLLPRWHNNSTCGRKAVFALLTALLKTGYNQTYMWRRPTIRRPPTPRWLQASFEPVRGPGIVRRPTLRVIAQHFYTAEFVKGALALFGVLVLLSCGDEDRSITGLAQKGDIARMHSLIDRGADINAKNDLGDTALVLASSKSHIEVVWLLLEKGPEVNAENKKGDTALKLAFRKGHAEIVKILKSHGAK
jgi:hypothetical protein